MNFLSKNFHESKIDLLAAALAYAERGWPVFPCHTPHWIGFGANIMACSCREGSACKDIGKHPRTEHGFREASCDPAQIAEWWRRWPDANIGIATGFESQLLVVDCDLRKGGDKRLRALEHAHEPLPRGGAVISGNGGHLYLRYSGLVVIGRSAAWVALAGVADALGEGLDTKCDGGYIVAPPSLHKSGKHYRWFTGAPPARLPDAPDWLISLARDGAERKGFARASSPHRSGGNPAWPKILTKDHPVGQRIAKLLGALDRGTYWKLNCPAHDDEHASAAIFPRPNGRIFARCFADCSDAEIMRAIIAKGI